MLLIIVIFFISITLAFGMLLFRAWEIRTARVSLPEDSSNTSTDISFRHIEKSMLYLTKHVIQSIVLTVVKSWFIFTTKTKKFLADKWPKIHDLFQKKPEVDTAPSKPSFFQKAILESKSKIRKIKERVKMEHGDGNVEN